MEYLGNTCDGNLYTDAKGKKGNEFINNLISYRSSVPVKETHRVSQPYK